MEVQAPVRFVWRYMLRRVWQSTSGFDMRKVWRKVWRRVGEDSSPAVSSAWDTQSITYSDCEAFFEAVSQGSAKKLNIMLYDTYGPSVTAELAKCYNEHGETPLLMAIRQQQLEMVKYLLQRLKVPVSQLERFVWKDVEYCQVPPLFAALLYGDTNIIRFLIAAEMHFGQIFTSINSVISSSNDRQQKIDILELLGGAYLCFHQLHGTRDAGLHCWKEAMHLRNSTTDGWQVIPKPEMSFSSNAARQAFGYTFEFTTLEQLDEFNASSLQLLTQSVLVSQRILNSISPGVNLFILAHLRQNVELCHKEEEYSRAIYTAITYFEYFKQHQLQNLDTTKITSSILDLTTKSFNNLRYGRLNNRPQLTFGNLMIVFEFASDYATHLQNVEDDHRSCTLYDLSWHIFDMVVLIVEMFPQLIANEIEEFKRCLHRFIHMDHRWDGDLRNFLHMICRCEDPSQYERPFEWNHHFDDDEDSVSSYYSDDDGVSSCNSDDDDHISWDDDEEDDSDTSSSASGCPSCGNHPDNNGPCDYDEDVEMIDFGNRYEERQVRNVIASLSRKSHLSLITLFLELGADPNSTDAQGQTALHLLAMNSDHFGPIEVMMEYGGHIDQVDHNSLTPLMHLERWHNQLMATGMSEPRLQALINNVLPLSCLAAKVLRGYRIPLDQEIPATLLSFLSHH